MSKTTPLGEVIPLYWDMDPQAYYVAGHVDEATFRKAMISFFGEDFVPPKAELRHIHARYVRAASNVSGVDRVFQTCKAGRGAMAVTAWDVP